MKLDARRAAAFLRDPGGTRCVLLHGDDAGLIRERAAALAALVAPADDPFRAVTLERDGHARLPEEAAARALTGGRRVVRVRDANDALAAPLDGALAVLAATKGDTLIVLEGPDLTARSKLRAALERSPDAAVIGCYPEEGRTLEAAIRDGLAARRVRAEPEALAYLARHLGADRAVTLGEIEKLALLAGDGNQLTLADVESCVGEAAALSVDDALFAATAGDAPAADRALSLALHEGAAPVGLLRAAQSHLQRLHRARLAMDASGRSAEDAARELRPPLFFRRAPGFVAALRRWPATGLARAIEAIVAAELGCKRTGAPDEAICREAIAAIARR